MASLETLHERANDALIKGENERAVQIYNEILDMAPDDEVAHSQLMDLYYENDKLKYYLTRANLNVVRNHLEHAINDCKKAINLAPSEVYAHLKLARLYAVTKKNLKAIDEFNKVIEIDPNEKSAYHDLINLYLIEQSQDSALNIAKNAVSHFENDKDFKNILAKLYFDTNNYERALEVVQDKSLKAKILLQDNQNDSAKEILDEIEKTNPKKDELAGYYALLAQYYYNIAQYDEALSALEKYVAQTKPNPVYFQMKALVYEALEDEENAHIAWGFCNKARGKIEEAIMQFQQAANINHKCKEAMIELANLYKQNGEKYVAIDYWQKIYELDNDKTAKDILADFYYKEGDLVLAQKYGKKIEEKQVSAKNYNEATEEQEGLLDKIMKLFGK